MSEENQVVQHEVPISMEGQWPPTSGHHDENDSSSDGSHVVVTKEDNTPKKKPVPEEMPPQATFRQLFMFAESFETRLLIIVASFFALISGLVFPSMAYLFARVFEDLSADVDDDFIHKVRNMAFSFMVLGVVLLVSMTAQATFMDTAAIQMTHAMQRDWLAALLRQDMAYHDIRDSTGEATLITINGNKYRKGMGKKLAAGVQYFITFVAGMAYAFYASWQNSLMVIAVTPAMVFSAWFLVQMNTSQSSRANASYAKAGSIVSASVQSIRTIFALNAVEHVIQDYKTATLKAQDGAVQQVWLVGLAFGSQMGSVIICFMVVTVFGTWLLYDNFKDSGCDPSGTVDDNDTCDPSSLDIFGSLLGVFIAFSILPQVSVAIEALAAARFACYPAIAAMERTTSHKKDYGTPPGGSLSTVKQIQPEVKSITNKGEEDVESGTKLSLPQHQQRRGENAELPPFVIDSAATTTGLQPDHIVGHIVFDSVDFAYPTRREQRVFRNFSLDIAPGTTVALVGPSGSGKSTAIALLERFYDPLAGKITLDGNELKDLNVKWLRQHVGLVSQEPKLFATSIRDNIAAGVGAGQEKQSVSQQDIEDAAKRANAHDFIQSFPQGYDTQVGDLGGQLSGGQRQRIAIARVLIKKPKILLLDEATSALDSESESTVQSALDALMESSNMTTFVIAHRLSTIRKADQIAVLSDGRVQELGTHSELVNRGGLYHALVQKQQIGSSSNVLNNNKQESQASSSTSFSRHESGNTSDSLGTSDHQDASTASLIKLENVHFTYPARPDIQVFHGMNLSVRRGETLALCGPSGQGKSTIIQLLERFYDPDGGKILYDGHDIRELNVKWWRDQIGLVSQEPTLFDCTIRENITYGMSRSVPMEEIHEAAKQANAHDFIMSFPDGYDTDVGAGSSLLVSGGQKQRICIARALLKKPKVLLLDEATSALDSESEHLVQEALDSLMADQHRTTIVIAHRLSTIRNADRIGVVDKVKIREIGTHDELMALNQRYARLVSLQDLGKHEGEAGDARPEEHKEVTVAKEQVDVAVEKVEEDQEEKKKELEKSFAARARAFASAENPYFLVGAIGAVLAGLVFPGWGVVLGYMIEVMYTSVMDCEDGNPVLPFSTCDDYYDDVASTMRRKARQISLGYVGLFFSIVVGSTLLYWGFGNASERINKRVRDSAFTSIVRQEVAWFDLRHTASITSQLAEDAALLHSFSGEPIRTLVLNIASVIVGVIISFIFMWPFALLSLATIPFLAFGAEMEMAMYYGSDEGDDAHMDENSAGSIAIEAVSNIRTIAALTLEGQKASQYASALKSEIPHPIQSSCVGGVAAGAGQFLQMWGYALMFWWGGWLLDNYTIWSFTDFAVSMFALMFSLYGTAVAAEGIVNKDKAQEAAKRIFALMDRVSPIDSLSETGIKKL